MLFRTVPLTLKLKWENGPLSNHKTQHRTIHACGCLIDGILDWFNGGVCDIFIGIHMYCWIIYILSIYDVYMMTSSNGNIFRVTGHLYGEFTGHRWFPRRKTSDTELWCFLWSALNKRLGKQSWGWWFETPLRPLWRHSNDAFGSHILRPQPLLFTCICIMHGVNQGKQAVVDNRGRRSKVRLSECLLRVHGTICNESRLEWYWNTFY